MRGAERRAGQERASLLARQLAHSSARFELLKSRLASAVRERQQLAERVATATSDPYLLLQAKGLVAGSWRAVAELADEVERGTALAARLALGCESGSPAACVADAAH